MSTYSVSQIRGHLRSTHPALNVGQRGRISAEALAVFEADVAAGRVTA